MSALFCSSAWAEVTLVDHWVVGGIAHTPSGSISGYFETGELDDTGIAKKFDYYGIAGGIDTSPISEQKQYDLDQDGTAESFAGSEVGLFYVSAYANVSASVGVYRPWGSAQAAGIACFTVDEGPLSLHWNYEIGPYSYGYPNTYQVTVYDWETMGYVGYYSNLVGSPSEGTETLGLTPGQLYVLYWDVQVGAGYGFDSSGSAQLTLDLADLGDTPSPIPAVIDVVGDTITSSTRSITCNIWPPDGYNVTDIAAESIRLQGTVSPASTSIRKGQMLVVKFLTMGLNLQPGNVELTVSGQLADGALFQGSDSIIVVQKGGKK